jgi:hypothetical protein
MTVIQVSERELSSAACDGGAGGGSAHRCGGGGIDGPGVTTGSEIPVCLMAAGAIALAAAVFPRAIGRPVLTILP